jgi:hypothetical protein
VKIKKMCQKKSEEEYKPSKRAEAKPTGSVESQTIKSYFLSPDFETSAISSKASLT